MPPVNILDPGVVSAQYDQVLVTREAQATIVRGDVVAYHTDGLKVIKAPTSTVISVVLGVAINGALAGEKVRVCIRGVVEALTNGATDTVAGQALDVSTTEAGVFVSGGAAAVGDRFISVVAYTTATAALTLMRIV